MAIQARRLLKLAAFLEKLPRAKFDFSIIVDQSGLPMLEALKAGKHPCGTVACAMGWMPAVFPKYLKWDDPKEPFGVRWRKNSSDNTSDVAREFFGLSYEQVYWLFFPNSSIWAEKDNGLTDDATPKQVARHIRRFVTKVKAGAELPA
jgi:hypothetical protein